MMWKSVACVGVLLVASACRGNNPDARMSDQTPIGDSRHGRRLIEQFECGTCHTIPGVRAANGAEASPLLWFSRRSFIGGEVPNTPTNLVRWLRDPREIEPRTAMPALGITDDQARDIAAYLYTLR